MLPYEAGDHTRAAAQGEERQQRFLAVGFAGHLGCPAPRPEPSVGGLANQPAVVRDGLDAVARDVFDRACTAAYVPAREIVAEIYDEVADGT